MKTRILVVDDSDVTRTVLRLVLEQAGYDAIEAASAEQAQGQLQGVQAVVCDLLMPGMDGFGFLKWLREQAGKPTLPVVFVTVDEREAQRAIGRQLGAAAWLTKPVVPQKLVQVLRQLGVQP